MAEPRVTVVVPTWRRPALLRETLASVAAQTFTDFECVVIDDGSGDDTESVVRAANENDGRFQYFDLKKGEGLGKSDTKRVALARNFGIQQARGVYVAFLDDDDLWLSHKLACQIAILDGAPSMSLVSAKIEKFGAESGLWPWRELSDGLSFELMLRGNEVATSTVVARTDVIRRVGGFDETLALCEDYDLWLRVAHDGALGFLPEVLVRYRVHPTNITPTGVAFYDALSVVYDRVLSRGLITAARRDQIEAGLCWTRARQRSSPFAKAKQWSRGIMLWARGRLPFRAR